MKKGIIGKKIGMTQIFSADGKVIPVTVVEAGPCTVTQKKTMENDGYEALQVGFGDVKLNRVNKPMKGHFAKNDVAPKRHSRNSALKIVLHLMSATLLKQTSLLKAKSLT